MKAGDKVWIWYPIGPTVADGPIQFEVLSINSYGMKLQPVIPGSSLQQWCNSSECQPTRSACVDAFFHAMDREIARLELEIERTRNTKTDAEKWREQT